MRTRKLIGAFAAAAVAFMPVAANAAQDVGSLVSVKGDAFVARDGGLVRAQPAMAVQAGDRVITRTGATADIALNGCSVNVAGGEMKTVSGDSCGSVQSASFTRAASQSSDSSDLLGHNSSGTYVVVFFALAAIIAGIVIIVRSTSP